MVARTQAKSGLPFRGIRGPCFLQYASFAIYERLPSHNSLVPVSAQLPITNMKQPYSYRYSWVAVSTKHLITVTGWYPVVHPGMPSQKRAMVSSYISTCGHAGNFLTFFMLTSSRPAIGMNSEVTPAAGLEQMSVVARCLKMLLLAHSRLRYIHNYFALLGGEYMGLHFW